MNACCRAVNLMIAVLCLCRPAISQVDHWETVIANGDSRKYFPGTSEPDSNWRKLSFNDGAWSVGPGGIGFGDSDDSTLIGLAPSLYMRISFTLTDTSKIVQAILNIDYDDGFIAFINNVEIARSNLGLVTGDHPPFSQFANGQHEAQMYQSGDPEGFIISKKKLSSLMINGSNLFSIQVHNATANSGDMSSNLWLSLGISDSTVNYGPNPPWFTNPFSDSNLPLVVIETGGKTIADDPRIISQMGIIENGPGIRNDLSDPFNNYDGQISIEIRGSTSQQYPKVSYGLETQDSSNANLNVSLLGMPAENDWVLYGPFPDKTMIRNVLTYDLFGRMGHWSPRTAFCELLINGQYKGVYVLLEKIKRDKNRIDIPELNPTDVSGDSLTGGYVFKVDKTTGTGNPAWTSPFSPDVYFQFHDPDDSDLVVVQRNYLESVVTAFETAWNSSAWQDPDSGYRKYMDVNSFADFLIMQELGRTVDGYRSSTFMHKTRDSRGGLIRMGPMWDFNLSFGNANYCDAYDTTGWQYDFNNICPGYTPEVPFWWSKLVTDPAFSNDLRCRYDELRNSILKTSRLHQYVDSVAAHLNESQIRNFERWPVLGQFVNWNYFVGLTYQSEVDYLKWWLQSRLDWMDQNIPGAFPVCHDAGEVSLTISEINYHSDSLNEAGDWFELFNQGTDTLDISRWIARDNNPANSFRIPPGTVIPPGGYFIICGNPAKFSTVYPGIANWSGGFGFEFGNGGDRIRLLNEHWMDVLDVNYDDNNPWPSSPDGGGFTLEVLNPNGDLNDPANWFAGCYLGSPGQAYFTPCGPVGITRATISGIPELVFAPNPFELQTKVISDPDWFGEGVSLELILTEPTGRNILKINDIPCCEFTLERYGLPSGIYFCSLIRDRNLLATGKVAIQ